MRPLLVLTALLAACGSSGGGSVTEAAGPYPVGHALFMVNDSARGRVLDAIVWYPAAESARAAAGVGVPVEELSPPANRVALQGLLATAPDPGTRRRTRSAPDAPAAATPARFPAVVFSHCHQCLAWSSFTIAERLASYGIVVIAPNHLDNTVFDQLAGGGATLDDAFLGVRAGDISKTLDVALGGDAFPAQLRGRIDAARLGMMGHSFGGATTGRVLQDDARFKAGVVMGAPVQSPFFPSVMPGRITQPLLLVELLEDNSIGTIGNQLLLGNFDDARQPAWLLQIVDGGHWSVSDLCGLTAAFKPGCTAPAQRQTNGAEFSYPDINATRSLAATYVTQFFALQLLGDSGAAADLAKARPGAKVEHHN